jgi:hypothetical protein
MNSKIIKSTLVNIDSNYRNKYPKNIYTSNNRILPPNPLQFNIDSNTIIVNYPNHGFSSNDNIIIQNVQGLNKTIVNSFVLINNFRYLVLLLPNHKITSNYKNYNNKLMVNINIFGDQNINNIINNIPLNNILGIKQILLYSDIPELLSQNNENLYNLINTTFGEYKESINNNVLFIDLGVEYINVNNNTNILDQTFKISFLDIAGIELGYINSNYPINNINYQSSQQITVIDNNTFQFTINKYSYITMNGGGTNIQIMKIINSITGYPDSSSYTINLKKSFNNVINIELISTEFPYVDLIIRKNVNDKLYWKNIDDGNTIYSITLLEGSYTTQTIVSSMLTAFNSTPRINSSPLFPKNNIFDVTFEPNNQKISFTSYNIVPSPDSLSITIKTINNNDYYILTGYLKDYNININDTIIITNSTNVTFKTNNIYSISSNYINNTNLTVYAIDSNNMTFDIILDKIENINTTIVSNESNGGNDINIKYKTKISLLFNYSDTFGDILGFQNVSDQYSITPFNTTVTNQDNYIYSNHVDSVGNIINYNGGFINLSGKYNYFLMYINNIEYIYNTNLPSAFAKIQLSGNPGDVLFNTFIFQPTDLYSKVYPISNLTELNVYFLYPDGSKVDFRNTSHSFTLRIVEEQIQNVKINLDSHSISFHDEMKNNKKN